MKATKHGEGLNDCTITVGVGVGANRRGLTEGLMRARLVEMVTIFAEDGPKMCLTKNDDVVETLTADTSKEAFADRVHPQRPDRTPNDFGICSFGDVVEQWTELGVPVPDDK